MSFPRYPKYKASGVEWLGDVPEGWEVKRLKHNVQLLTVKTSRRSNPIGLENIESWSGRFIETETDFEGEGIAFESGDLLFGKLRPYLAKAYLAKSPGEAVGDLLVMKPNKSRCSGRFLNYLILTKEFISIVDGSTFGTKMPRANWEFVGGMLITLPPLPEQTAIADFLDRETGKIDELVAEQRRLIELLKEKRQAVTSHAVTKGLNPHAPMKPSGIEWLGDVPENWVVLRLKFLCKVQTGGRDTENAVEGGKFPFFVRSQTVERIDSMAYDCEAVLTAGDGVGVGKVFHYHKGPFDFHQRVYMMSDFQSVSGPFFFHFLRENFFKVALEGGAKSTVDSLRRPMIMNFPVCVPPVSEQSAIVSRIESETAKFDTLTAEAQRAIDLLQERRTALISAAVTGQIDVRPQTHN